MKKAFLLLITILLSSNLYAASTVEEKVKHYQQQYDNYAYNVKGIREDVMHIDDQMEYKINKIIGLIAVTRDSRDSNKKVIYTKKKMIDGLEKSILEFKKQRESMRNQFHVNTKKLKDSQIQADIVVYNKKIDERIDQTVKILRSLTEYKDFHHYHDEYHYKEYNTREYHNKQIGKKTELEKRDATNKIKKTIDYLKAKNKRLNSQLRTARSKRQRDIYLNQIAENEAIIKKRESQIGQIAGSSSTRPVNRDKARENEKKLNEYVTELKADYGQIKKLKIKYDQERAKMNNAEKYLNAWKKKLPTEK